MNRTILALILLIFLASSAHAQPVNDQEWQSATITGDALTITCRTFVLPKDVGRLLSEPASTTTEGEMSASMRAAHPVKIRLLPQTGTADNITSISSCVDGTRLMLSTTTVGHSITIVHTPGQIEFVGGYNVVLTSPLEVFTLVRKAGLWVAEGKGSGGMIISEGQAVRYNLFVDTPTEGSWVVNQSDCSSAIGKSSTDVQICRDSDDGIIYCGTGTGIEVCGFGSVGGGSGTWAEVLANSGITMAGRDNAIPFVDTNGDGTICYTGSTGPVCECVIDYKGPGETSCTPTVRKTFEFTGRCYPDGTRFQRTLDATLNGAVFPWTARCADSLSCDDTGAQIVCTVPMPDSWDGVTLQAFGSLHVLEASGISGTVRLDWTGYCTEHGQANAASGWASEGANSVMTFDLTGQAQHRKVAAATVGNIPLTGCTGTAKRTLFLRAQADTALTSDNLHQLVFFEFLAERGDRAYTD
jgi:hypothetical protein